MRLLSGGLLCPSQSSGALEGSARRQEVPLRGTIEKWPRAQGTWPDYATWWTTLSSSGRSILPRIVSNLLATGHFDQMTLSQTFKKGNKMSGPGQDLGVCSFHVKYCLTTTGAIFCQRTLWCGRDRLLRPSGRTWSVQPQSLLVLPHQVFAKFRGRIALREWIHRCIRYFPSQQYDIVWMKAGGWVDLLQNIRDMETNQQTSSIKTISHSRMAGWQKLRGSAGGTRRKV